MWAYAWLLILVASGLGLALAAWIGAWGDAAIEMGVWMAIINGAVFGLFATLFGNLLLKNIGTGAILLGGFLLLLRWFLNRPRGEA